MLSASGHLSGPASLVLVALIMFCAGAITAALVGLWEPRK